MHLKIKNPDYVVNNQVLLGAGIFCVACIIIAAVGTYLAGGITEAWRGFDIILREMTQGERFAPLIILFGKLFPLICVAIFIGAVAEKIKQNQKDRKTPHVTAVDFDSAGVLLTYSNKHTTFIPYQESAFDITVIAHKIARGKHGQKVPAIGSVNLTFAQGTQVTSVRHFTYKPFVCLKKLLDRRQAFQAFTLNVMPFRKDADCKEAADIIRPILQDYIQYGVMLTHHRAARTAMLVTVMLCLGIGGISCFFLFQISANLNPIHRFFWVMLPGFILFLPGCYLLGKYIKFRLDEALLKRLKEGK